MLLFLFLLRYGNGAYWFYFLRGIVRLWLISVFLLQEEE